MKSLMKSLVGILVASVAITACGKKGGKSAAAPAPGPGAGAAGVCQLSPQGTCVGGVAQSGVVPANTWDGRVSVVNQGVYMQFLVDNGLCYAQQCTMASGFFRLKIQTIEDQGFQGARVASLPNAVNFAIYPRMSGYGGGRVLSTQGDGYASGNGFQIVYNRFNGMGYGNGHGNGYSYRPGVVPYGQPINQAAVPAPNNTVQIGVVFADATQTIINVSIVYKGTQIASGQIRSSYPNGLNLGLNQGGHQQGGYAHGAAPATLPYDDGAGPRTW